MTDREYVVNRAHESGEMRQYNAPYDEYTNENGGTVYAHKVTDDTRGEVRTVGQGRVWVEPGSYVVMTTNPYYHDVVPGDVFEKVHSTKDGSSGSTVDSEPTGWTDWDSTQDSDTPAYDPAEHTASEVRDYLSRVDDTEKQRVMQAERQGKNRKL